MDQDPIQKRRANTRRSRAMVRLYREGKLTGRDASKLSDLEMAAMLDGGATLEEIGMRAGLSRERVRQRLTRIGLKPSTRLSILKLMEVIRSSPVESLAAAARHIGTQGTLARRALDALGLVEPVERLFRLRRRAAERAIKRAMVVALQTFAAELGHTPRAIDLTRNRPPNVPSPAQLQSHFGSVAAAMTAAGLPPNQTGHRVRSAK